eukprot:2130628-Prymnesium_polylepis.1
MPCVRCLRVRVDGDANVGHDAVDVEERHDVEADVLALCRQRCRGAAEAVRAVGGSAGSLAASRARGASGVRRRAAYCARACARRTGCRGRGSSASTARSSASWSCRSCGARGQGRRAASPSPARGPAPACPRG